jgi:hypothetical protein
MAPLRPTIYAEARLKAKSMRTAALPVDNAQKMLHELQVHQVELEMQNDALCEARSAEEQALFRYTELYDFAPTGYFILDHSSKIAQVNLRGQTCWSLKDQPSQATAFNLLTQEHRVTLSDCLHSLLMHPGACRTEDKSTEDSRLNNQLTAIDLYNLTRDIPGQLFRR